jgi:hypothetical protein
MLQRAMLRSFSSHPTAKSVSQSAVRPSTHPEHAVSSIEEMNGQQVAEKPFGVLRPGSEPALRLVEVTNGEGLAPLVIFPFMLRFLEAFLIFCSSLLWIFVAQKRS